MRSESTHRRLSGFQSPLLTLLMPWTALHRELLDSRREAGRESHEDAGGKIGRDIAKTVFQVHGVDAGGEVIIRQRLARRRVLAFFEKLAPCLAGIEACSTSHYWARELIARGHEVRLIPAQYVKPYVKRGKNGAADAEAICEAVTRPTMRFVPVKTPEQQNVMMLDRVRLMLNRQRAQLSNAIRAHLSGFGIRGTGAIF
jgi:transposase